MSKNKSTEKNILKIEFREGFIDQRNLDQETKENIDEYWTWELLLYVKKSYQEREKVACREDILAKHLDKDGFNTQDTLEFRELLKLNTKNKLGWGVGIGLSGYFFKEDVGLTIQLWKAAQRKVHNKASVKYQGLGDITDSPSEMLSLKTRWAAPEVLHQKLTLAFL